MNKLATITGIAISALNCACYSAAASEYSDAELSALFIRAKAHDIQALRTLTDACEGDDAPLQGEQALEVLKPAAAMGIAKAQALLALCYYHGKGTETDTEMAEMLADKVRAGGDAAAIALLEEHAPQGDSTGDAPEDDDAVYDTTIRINYTYNRAGCSPLHHAVLDNDVANTRRQLKEGAYLEARDGEGHTPLMLATLEGCHEPARLLIKAGADVDAKSLDYNTSVLMMAALKGYPEIVRMLLERNPQLNVRNKSGYTALMLAAKGGYADIVRMLLNAGADKSVRDNSGKRAYNHATTTETRNLLR